MEIDYLVARLKLARQLGDIGLLQSLLTSQKELLDEIAIAQKMARSGSKFSRPLPESNSISALQFSIHDNWGQDTKPKGRKPKTGKRPREHAVRYAVTVAAWDVDPTHIDLAKKNWGYELNSDLFTATQFRKKSYELRNLVKQPDGAWVVDDGRRNAVKSKISKEYGEMMLSLAEVFPDALFACLRAKDGCTPRQVAVIQMAEDVATGAFIFFSPDEMLELPPFSTSLAGGKPFAQISKVVFQSRYAREPEGQLAKWHTASLITSNTNNIEMK